MSDVANRCVCLYFVNKIFDSNFGRPSMNVTGTETRKYNIY